MTKPFQQLRVTQLMGTGAQTLIVPDTNTTAFLLCISILYISVRAETNWVMKMLRLVSEYITSILEHTDLILLTYLGFLISVWKQLFVIQHRGCLHRAARKLCSATSAKPSGFPDSAGDSLPDGLVALGRGEGETERTGQRRYRCK